MGTTLSWYQSDASALLRDEGYSFITQPRLTRWINEARRQVAQRTGCIMRLISGQSAFGASAQAGAFIPGGAQPGALPGALPNTQVNAATNSFQAIPGVERYAYQGFVNPYLQAQHAGCASVIDVASCSLDWGGSTQGSPRPSLAWLPWEDLQAYARAYAVLVTSYPYYWSCLNDGENGELWLFPVPSQVMEMELLVYAIPKDLYTNDDYDAIPAGFQNAVKFGAAGLAFMMSSRYAQAQIMFDQFADRLGVARTAVDRGKITQFYQTAFG